MEFIEQAFANLVQLQFKQLWNRVYYPRLYDTARELALYSLVSSLALDPGLPPEPELPPELSESPEPRKKKKRCKNKPSKKREHFEQVLQEIVLPPRPQEQPLRPVPWDQLIPPEQAVHANFLRFLGSLESIL